MFRIIFLFFNLLYGSSLLAQAGNKTGYARIIKITGTDSLVKLNEKVKKQLTAVYYNRSENPGTKAVSHLLLNFQDNSSALAAGRWLAAKQKQDIYQVRLSGLVSKYIGETEKNLEQLFEKALNGNMILFFDEGDALFGKRKEPGTPEDKDRQATIDLFIHKLDQHKGTVLLYCSGEDCLGKMSKLSFIKITG